jgi:hypothetical protein
MIANAVNSTINSHSLPCCALIINFPIFFHCLMLLFAKFATISSVCGSISLKFVDAHFALVLSSPKLRVHFQMKVRRSWVLGTVIVHLYSLCFILDSFVMSSQIRFEPTLLLESLMPTFILEEKVVNFATPRMWPVWAPLAWSVMSGFLGS